MQPLQLEAAVLGRRRANAGDVAVVELHELDRLARAARLVVVRLEERPGAGERVPDDPARRAGRTDFGRPDPPRRCDPPRRARRTACLASTVTATVRTCYAAPVAAKPRSRVSDLSGADPGPSGRHGSGAASLGYFVRRHRRGGSHAVRASRRWAFVVSGHGARVDRDPGCARPGRARSGRGRVRDHGPGAAGRAWGRPPPARRRSAPGSRRRFPPTRSTRYAPRPSERSRSRIS